MSSLFQNLADSVSYKLYQATYNPEAEQYAASVAASKEAEDAAAKKQANAQATDAATKAAAEKAVADQKAAVADDAASQEINAGRMVSKIIGTALPIFVGILLFFLFTLGASYAVNLNIYRTWPYRLLYAIYGFIFAPLVILYVILYRWWWKGLRPRYYGFLPLLPYHINHPILAFLLSWLSYRPDDCVHALEEWNAEQAETYEHC